MNPGDPLPESLALFLTKHFGESLDGIRLRTDDLGHRILNRRTGDDAVAVGDDIYMRRHLTLPPSDQEAGLVGREVAHVLQHRRDQYHVSAMGALALFLEQEAERHQARVEGAWGGRVDPVDALNIQWEGRQPSPDLEVQLRQAIGQELMRMFPGEVVHLPQVRLSVGVPQDASPQALVERVVRRVREAVQATPRPMPRRSEPPPGTTEGRRIRLKPPGDIGPYGLTPNVKQARHILNTPEFLEDKGGAESNSYFLDPEDAQKVLDAYHAGRAVVMGRTVSRNHLTVWCGEVTGYVRRLAPHGFVDVQTHLFLFKGGVRAKTGASTTSVVPADPDLMAFNDLL